MPEASEEFKDLFIGMFDPNPESRFTLEQIEQSDWLTEREDKEDLKKMRAKIN